MEHAIRLVYRTDCMLKARVAGGRIRQVANAELPYASETLKGRTVDDRNLQVGEADHAPDSVLKRLRLGRGGAVLCWRPVAADTRPIPRQRRFDDLVDLRDEG